MIGAKGAQPDGRHTRAGQKRSLRDQGWIDSLDSRSILCLHSSLLAVMKLRRRETIKFYDAKLWQ